MRQRTWISSFLKAVSPFLHPKVGASPGGISPIEQIISWPNMYLSESKGGREGRKVWLVNIQLREMNDRSRFTSKDMESSRSKETLGFVSTVI